MKADEIRIIDDAEQLHADAEAGVWHKPSEKLPEDCSCVLCHLKDDGYETAYYEDKRFTFCAAGYGIEDVVAWREIPKHQEIDK